MFSTDLIDVITSNIILTFSPAPRQIGEDADEMARMAAKPRRNMTVLDMFSCLFQVHTCKISKTWFCTSECYYYVKRCIRLSEIRLNILDYSLDAREH